MMDAGGKAAAALAALLILAAPLSAVGRERVMHRFVALGHAEGDEARLQRDLRKAGGWQADFIIVSGVKASDEPCSDKLYKRRKQILDDATPPVILSVAASDWTGCRNSAARSAAVERLNRLREVFFFDAYSLGERRLKLTRLSSSPRFRSYAENARWEMDKVLYATLNVPSNNNNYLRAAGRNSEYEDRLVANRSWLRRLFAQARQDKMRAVVLFMDARIAARPANGTVAIDGYAEVRRQVEAHAKRYRGKILLVDAALPVAEEEPAIVWRGNIGYLSLGAERVLINVMPHAPQPFMLGD